MLNSLIKGDYLLKCQLEIISKCNLNCSFCYLGENVTKTFYQLELIDLKKIIPDLVKMGCFEISLSGGEPLLHKDFFKIADYLFFNGFRMTLFTNAVLLKREKINKILSRFDKIIVNVPFADYQNSLFSSKKKINNYFSKLHELNPKVQAKIVANKRSINLIDVFFDICEKNKIKHLMSNELIGYNKDRYYKNNNFNCNSFLKKFIFYNVKLEHIHSCSAGIDNISINSKGDVGPCNMIDIKWGNIKIKSIKEIYFSKKRVCFLKNKKKVEIICNNCDFKKSCYVWCFGDHYNLNHSYEINGEICNLAKKINQFSCGI